MTHKYFDELIVNGVCSCVADEETQAHANAHVCKNRCCSRSTQHNLVLARFRADALLFLISFRSIYICMKYVLQREL